MLARAAHDMTYEPGTRLASQDDLGVTFFTVIEGAADVVFNGKAIKHLGPGDYFGEMSIIDRAPRSADVVAASKLRRLSLHPVGVPPVPEGTPRCSLGAIGGALARVREAERRAVLTRQARSSTASGAMPELVIAPRRPRSEDIRALFEAPAFAPGEGLPGTCTR